MSSYNKQQKITFSEPLVLFKICNFRGYHKFHKKNTFLEIEVTGYRTSDNFVILNPDEHM